MDTNMFYQIYNDADKPDAFNYYALLTRAPVDAHQKQAFDVVSPRLACVKPVASVHPEPGSNSTL